MQDYGVSANDQLCDGYWLAGGFGNTYPYAYIAGTPVGTWTGWGSGLFGNSGGYQGYRGHYNTSSSKYVLIGNNTTIYYASTIGGALTGVVLPTTYPLDSYYANGYSVIVECWRRMVRLHWIPIMFLYQY